MISVVCWLWADSRYRTQFTAAHVNALAAQVRRHYAARHHFICVTNETGLFGRGVELVRDPADFAGIPSPHGGRNPSCYRRLRMFAPDAAATFGERFVSLDLDTVITGDLRPIWDRHEDFVIWRDPFHADSYCGSMMLLTAGSRPQVWQQFAPASSPRQALQAGCRGSDQGWIRHCLGPGEATWGRADGVYSYRADLASGAKPLPADARLVAFHGATKPWDEGPQRLGWVQAAGLRGNN